LQGVASASNLGIPICKSAPDSKIAHDLKELAKKLGKVEFESEKKNFFTRFKDLLS